MADYHSLCRRHRGRCRGGAGLNPLEVTVAPTELVMVCGRPATRKGLGLEWSVDVAIMAVVPILTTLKVGFQLRLKLMSLWEGECRYSIVLSCMCCAMPVPVLVAW